jgi:hypothetical protein
MILIIPKPCNNPDNPNNPNHGHHANHAHRLREVHLVALAPPLLVAVLTSSLTVSHTRTHTDPLTHSLARSLTKTLSYSLTCSCSLSLTWSGLTCSLSLTHLSLAFSWQQARCLGVLPALLPAPLPSVLTGGSVCLFYVCGGVCERWGKGGRNRGITGSGYQGELFIRLITRMS